MNPQGCGIHSQRLGSACIQLGRCDYPNEIEFWKGETPAHVWSSAQGIREKLVAAVRAGDCQSLF